MVKSNLGYFLPALTVPYNSMQNVCILVDFLFFSFLLKCSHRII